MIKREINGKEYLYDKEQTNLIIDSKVLEDFTKFCKEKKLKKCKVVEDFFKAVLLNWHDGSLDATKGYTTVRVL